MRIWSLSVYIPHLTTSRHPRQPGPSAQSLLTCSSVRPGPSTVLRHTVPGRYFKNVNQIVGLPARSFSPISYHARNKSHASHYDLKIRSGPVRSLPTSPSPSASTATLAPVRQALGPAALCLLHQYLLSLGCSLPKLPKAPCLLSSMSQLRCHPLRESLSDHHAQPIPAPFFLYFKTIILSNIYSECIGWIPCHSPVKCRPCEI